MFRELSEKEEKEFRQWARENYTPGEEIQEVWHPVVQNECEKMNEEQGDPKYPVDYELSENQKQFVADAQDQGLEIKWDYSGRFMYGRECPAVEVDGAGDFSTKAEYQQDQLGLGLVIYAMH